MSPLKSTEVTGVAHLQDASYDEMLAQLQARLEERTAGGTRPVFTTDVANLWEVYLESFPAGAERQYHTCHACRRFIERFGGLVVIDDAGRTEPVLWNAADHGHAYRGAWAAMAQAVGRAKVTGVFLASEIIWGTPEAGGWQHMAVCPRGRQVFVRVTQTAGQAMAEKREDFQTVLRALAEFTPAHLETAVSLLKTEALYRSEKVLGQAEWLLRLSKVWQDKALFRRHGINVLWLAVATAPAGFCHPRSSMIGTLLEDIAAGKSFEEVSRAFAAKMHPLGYQRPKAAPTAGAIAAAEKVVAQLGAAGALARRFCRIEEVEALWRPAPPVVPPSTGGVFGHLTPKGAVPESSIVAPAQVMTWEKFARTVLPTAERIELQAPYSGNYAALVTAVTQDAPPILQWDRGDRRNPVSWYVWHGGSLSVQWSLAPNQFYDVSAVTLKPSMWHGVFDHQGSGVLFLVEKAKESRMAGAALFPEFLKAEFHGIRSVIEAYSRAATIEGMDEPHAAGLMLQKATGTGASTWNATVRVWASGRSVLYRLDRWD